MRFPTYLIGVVAAGAVLASCSSADEAADSEPVTMTTTVQRSAGDQAGAEPAERAEDGVTATVTSTVTEAASSGETLKGEEVPLADREKLMSATVSGLGYLPESEQVTLSNGVWTGEYLENVSIQVRGNSDEVLTADNMDVFKSDLDGDGAPELIANLTSTGGGSGWAQQYVVFDESGQQKAVLNPTEEMGIQRGGFTINAIKNGKLYLSWMAWADGDPACCGSKTGAGTFTWDGETLTAVEGPFVT